MATQADIIRTINYLNAIGQINRHASELRKKKEMESINISQHGLIEDFILSDRILVEVIISTDEFSARSSCILLDTGANISAISPELWRMPVKTDETMEIIGAHTRTKPSMITGRVTIENSIVIDSYEIMIADLDAFNGTGIDGVIGMDIIQAGDLHIYQKDGLPYFEFSL